MGRTAPGALTLGDPAGQPGRQGAPDPSVLPPALPVVVVLRLLALARAPLAVVAVLVVLAFWGLAKAHFVGAAEDGRVAVYQGIPWDVGAGISLYRARYVSDLRAVQLTADERRRLFDHDLTGYADARRRVAAYELAGVAGA